MNNLVKIQNNKITTTSNKIAEVFCKQHKDVIKAINKIIGNLSDIKDLEQNDFFNERNFAPVNYLTSYYVDDKGEKRPQYIVTRDGFTLLAMGFTGAKALKFKIQYIQAFNEMEEKLKNQSAVQREYWEVDDSELLRCLHAWHHTKARENTLKTRKLHDENRELKEKLLRIEQVIK